MTSESSESVILGTLSYRFVPQVIDSLTHPVVMKNAPAYQHNMMPFEALSLGSGQDIQEFADLWKESVRQSAQDD